MWPDGKTGHSVKTSASPQVQLGLASHWRHRFPPLRMGTTFLLRLLYRQDPRDASALWPAGPLMLSEDSCWEHGDGGGGMEDGRPGPGRAGVPTRNVLQVSVRSYSLFRQILSEHLVHVTSTARCSSARCSWELHGFPKAT